MSHDPHRDTAGLTRARLSFLQHQQVTPRRPDPLEPADPGADVLSSVWLAYVLGIATAVVVGAIGGVL